MYEKLLPCPFCGGEAEIKKRGNSICHFVAKCKMCRAEMKGTIADQALAAWNRRVQPVSGNPITDNKPITNGDRIRSMSDKELAEWICGVYDEDDGAKFINGIIVCDYDPERVKDWLKQPAKEGTND